MFNNTDNTNEIFKYRFRLCEGDEDFLLISEKDQKAYLPYKYLTVKNIYESNQDKYSNIGQVVENDYIVSLDNFRNSAFSRFRETFKLNRYTEKKSLIESFDFALELMFRYDLNPIIVAACRSLDELDSYLNCLENNRLEDFNCFKIHFEFIPKTIK